MTAAPPRSASAASVLARLQRGLEALYRVETRLDVQRFVVSDDERSQALAHEDGHGGGGTARRPREQLLVSHEGGELALGLYLDAAALANLERHDPGRVLDERNFADFCLAVEGVSHFIYVALCAAANRLVTALELELQAEVDKFVACLLVPMRLEEAAGRRSRGLRARLYHEVRYAHDLDHVERARYATANDQARAYAGALERRYLPHDLGAMLAELRRFYRLSLAAKLGHIARLATAGR
jgi:hypothetical protein